MYKVVVRSRYALSHINRVRLFSSTTRPDDPLFPPKDEFPSRHIGPRDRDIITMLDTLGFKVNFIF